MLIASLPETISARIRQDCLDSGVVPLQGQRDALEALALAAAVGTAWRAGPGPRLQMPSMPFGGPASRTVRTLSEHEGKAALARIRRCAMPARRDRGARGVGRRAPRASVSRWSSRRSARISSTRPTRGRGAQRAHAGRRQAAGARLSAAVRHAAGRGNDRRRRRRDSGRASSSIRSSARCWCSAPAACSPSCWPTA